MKITLYPSDDFDKALSLNREPGTEFVLTKGSYKTKGNWYYKDYLTLAAGCKLYGEGSTLTLSPDAVRNPGGVVRPDRDLNVIWTNQNAHVENLVIDGNEQLFNNADPSKSWYVTCGIRGVGKNTFKGLTVQNVRGTLNGVNTLTPQIESFAISTYGPTGGSVIESCKVQQCPENSYVSSFTIGHTGTQLSQSVVTDCKIHVGNGNWYGYGVNQNVLISKSSITNGCQNAVYNDTDNTEDVIIDECNFNNIDKLVSLIIVSNKPEFRRNIKVKNTKIAYAGGLTKHLVELWDKNVDSVKRQLGPVLLQNISVSLFDENSKLYVASVGNDVKPVVLVDSKMLYKIEVAGNNTFLNFG